MSTYDVYENLNRLKVLLVQDGRNELAEQITEAVETSATGTEVLMQVHYLLREFQETNAPISLATKTQLADIVKYLMDALDYS